MTPDDLANLHAQTFETPRPWSAREFSSLLSQANIFLVTGSGPSFALGQIIVDEAEILTLSVTPEAQGRGHGRAILQAYETQALALGAVRSLLEVSTENQPAIGLYHQAGYCESGRRPRYYNTPNGHKIDALLYSKLLKIA